jgi:cytoskeletal protein CcmA (bactofilin family)
MFTKKPEKDVSLAAPGARPPSLEPARRAQASASLIGQDLAITGNLNSKGDIEIEGEVQGDVHARRIIVGVGAHVTGSLLAEEVVVRGAVQGQIRGNSVTFQATSRVEGDIFHRSLLIEQGAQFEGRSRRSDDPLSVPRGGNGPLPTPPDAGAYRDRVSRSRRIS